MSRGNFLPKDKWFKIDNQYATSLLEYYVWHNMIQRCHNINNKQFNQYGKRGITVCQEWINSFNKFIEDMGLKPGPEYTLERLNNNKEYSKNNCKWATRTEQARNNPHTILTIETANEIRKLYETRKYTQKQLANMFGVTRPNITSLINNKTWKNEEKEDGIEIKLRSRDLFS